MGKKVKKEDKAPPEDVFEPLALESRQAATVVLMLSSPEEEVLAKACEAIYKFVEKCEENKKTLLDLDAVSALLKLIQHEDRIVRRNAMMALGVMAGHAEVRRFLRKQEEAIPSVVNLLNPEESTVVHEFAALCLAYLSQDYSSKVMIYEHNAIEPLIRCLSSDDPDVQKNAIETLAYMLQDYETKTALRELGGFPPVLDLMKAEYPVIQHLALVSLQRATEDAENRAALREQEAVGKFIDFIGRPEYSDLHVFAVTVLSNCLEDVESVEMIKENGGLQKLVAFITDTQPPEEETKKDKKGAASRAGKKGKKGDDDGKQRGITNSSRLGKLSRNDKHKGKGGDGEGIIGTLPEVKEHAAKAIARAAKNADNRKILHECEVEKMLIILLSHENPDVQVSAAQALAVMSENLLSRDSIAGWEGIEPLIKMCKNDNPDVREAASLALANLTTACPNNCNEVLQKNGVEPLVNLLSDSREAAQANAAVTLTNMSTDEHMRSEIQRQGIMVALIGPLSSSNKTVQSKCALAVAAFCCDADARTIFRENEGISPLVNLLHSSNDDVRRSASWAVTVCAVDEPTAMEICRHGGLEQLQEIQLSSTRKNAFTDVALERLLDSNLSAKYAFTGYLGADNLVTDGFFDCGQLKPGIEFQSLEDYCLMPVHQKRPILLINPKPEKPSTPVQQMSDIDLAEKGSKGSVSGKSSRTGRDSKSKSRKQIEREEKQRQEELEARLQAEAEAAAQQEDQPFSPPGDSNLIKYIDDVIDRIQPLPTTRDQVVALAQYVAEKMGGPIEYGQLANFSWELPLSQIKFDLKSNVIPIGMVKYGIHYHRALLFKALGDRIAIGSTLVRGEYNRAWNEVLLTEPRADTPGGPEYPPKLYIVDLIHQPGRLMRADAPEAVTYQKL